METRLDAVTMHGQPLTLIGAELKVGEKAPDFQVVDNDMTAKTLKDFNEKVLIISSIPSLDTPVCDMETRRFNTEASSLDADIKILTISVDLPFAQKRWCGAAGVDQVTTLSDYQTGDFGKAYGVMIMELHLLARAIFILDSDKIIRYIQLVKEVSKEPDYDAVLAAAKGLL